MPAPGPDSGGMLFRAAGAADAPAIAALHADSWQRHYRGIYTDSYLDGKAPGQLRGVWAERLRHPLPGARTIVAELDGEIAGFAHLQLDNSATWGALLDNLHVRYGVKRQGTGTRLLVLTAQAVLDAAPGSGLYLWVLEQNAAARAFYDARGGTCVERTDEGPPDGDPASIIGHPAVLRYAWPDPAKLAGRA
jgi:ribosomal protein S18 acetylase RimI-like enzyme